MNAEGPAVTSTIDTEETREVATGVKTSWVVKKEVQVLGRSGSEPHSLQNETQ